MLTTKQSQLIPLIINLGNIDKACKTAKIDRTTYYNWLENEELAKELKKQQDCVYNSALNELKNLNTDAVNKYRELLNCQDKTIEFRTASAIIDYTNKFVENKDIKERLEAME